MQVRRNEIKQFSRERSQDQRHDVRGSPGHLEMAGSLARQQMRHMSFPGPDAALSVPELSAAETPERASCGEKFGLTTPGDDARSGAEYPFRRSRIIIPSMTRTCHSSSRHHASLFLLQYSIGLKANGQLTLIMRIRPTPPLRGSTGKERGSVNGAASRV